MWEWLKIAMLGKAVLLTQGPIDIGNDWKRLTPPVPLTVLDQGAHIDIFMNPLAKLPKSPEARREKLKLDYPVQCVRARIQSDDDKNVTFRNEDARATEKEAHLVLYPTGPFPKGQVYSRIWVRASCPLNHVTVLWTNNAREGEQ